MIQSGMGGAPYRSTAAPGFFNGPLTVLGSRCRSMLQRTSAEERVRSQLRASPTMEQLLLGQVLRNFRLVSQEDLDRCLEIQRRLAEPEPLGRILVDQGYIDESILSTVLTMQRRQLEPGVEELGMSTRELDRRLQTATLESYLQLAKDLGASDLYLSAGKPPMVRVHGQLKDLQAEVLATAAVEGFIEPLLQDSQRAELESSRKADFCVTVPECGRVRVSVFSHHGGVGAVLRLLPNRVKPIETLGLPKVVQSLTELSNGMVLITGSIGCGKSTTLAALIDQMNRRRRLHIVTLEDPIETVFESNHSLITQREVQNHTTSFADGLRAALREDPDVIVVGELRDPETFQVALTAAETGHLVLGTLHTRTAHGTILRLIEQFPPERRAHVRTMLAGALRAVVCQELIPTVKGNSRALATEIMLVNPAIANLIREGRSWQIPMVMQTNAAAGMRLLDDSLAMLVRHERISVEEALCRATDRKRFLVPV
jgi:twitching motility protein PilT